MFAFADTQSNCVYRFAKELLMYSQRIITLLGNVCILNWLMF